MQFKCQFYVNFWLNSYVTLSGNYLTMMHNKILLSKNIVEYLISKLLRNKDNFLYETQVSWKTYPFLLMKTTLKKPWRSEEVYRRRWNVRREVCCDKALEYDKAFVRDFQICWLFVKCYSTACCFIFKACVRYFLTNFYFSPIDSPSKTMRDVFHFI